MKLKNTEEILKAGGEMMYHLEQKHRYNDSQFIKEMIEAKKSTIISSKCERK